MLPHWIPFFAIQAQNFCKFLQKICNWTFTFQYKCKRIASSYFWKNTKILQHLAKHLWFVTKNLQLKLKISNHFQNFCILNLQIFCDLAQKFFNHKRRFLNLNYYFEGYHYSIDCSSCLLTWLLLCCQFPNASVIF